MKTQKTPLFQGIGEAALAEMFTCGGARCKTYAKGEVLLRAGCITREVGIVQAGGVNIENIDLWGNRSILSHVPAGQVFAETYAFCGEPMMVDVVAAEETEVLFLNMDVLIHTPHPDSEWQPVLVQNLLNISLHKNLALSERIFCTAPKTVRGRLLGIRDTNTVVGAVAQKTTETRKVLRCRDNHDIADTRKQQSRERVVDHRLIINRKQLLADIFRNRIQAAAAPAR